MMVHRRVASLLVLLVLVGCGPAAPAVPSSSGAQSATPPPATRKTITASALNSVKGFSPWLIGTTGGGARAMFEISTNGLVSTDAAGNLEARLAAKLPSFDDGTVVILPDGRMSTTWKVRPNVKWHDGAPFTVDDVLFSYQVNSHPEIPTPSTSSLPQVDQVEALDAETFRLT